MATAEDFPQKVIEPKGHTIQEKEAVKNFVLRLLTDTQEKKTRAQLLAELIQQPIDNMGAWTKSRRDGQALQGILNRLYRDGLISMKKGPDGCHLYRATKKGFTIAF